MHTSDQLAKHVEDISRALCVRMCSLPRAQNIPVDPAPPALIIPAKRNQQDRLSEQESRFLYCELLHTLKLPYFYSVETPTKELYRFSSTSPDSTDQNANAKKRSASTDLTLWKSTINEYSRVLNVEFKAHNAPQPIIQKDIEKLLSERITGHWVHTIDGLNNGTLPALFEKFSKSLKHCSADAIKTEIFFTLCIAGKGKCGLFRCFQWDPAVSTVDFDTYVDEFFQLPGKVMAGQIQHFDDSLWLDLMASTTQVVTGR